MEREVGTIGIVPIVLYGVEPIQKMLLSLISVDDSLSLRLYLDVIYLMCLTSFVRNAAILNLFQP